MQKFCFAISIFIVLYASAYAGESKLQIIDSNGSARMISLDEWEKRQNIHCEKVLDLIIKDLTLRNLELSYDRLTNKLLLAYITLYDKSQDGNYQNNVALITLAQSLKKLDPEFERHIKKHKTAAMYRNFLTAFSPLPSKSKFFDMIKEWKQYQDKNPEVFDSLEKSLFLDDWDIQMAKILDDADNINPYSYRLIGLAKSFDKPNLLKNKKDLENPEAVKEKIDQSQTEILGWINQIYKEHSSRYKDYCDQDTLDFYLSSNKSCSLKIDFTKPDSSQISQLEHIASLVTKEKIKSTPDVPNLPMILNPDKLFKIKEVNFYKNPDAKYCTREMDIVDTIIIHHTATEETQSLENINNSHISRSTGDDQWYMIGYNYLVSGNYEDSEEKISSTVTRGRPENMIGAHAGGQTKSLSKEMKKTMKKSEISCGKDGKPRESKAASKYFDWRGQINGNYNSLGIAIVGNYSPRYYSSVGGVWTLKNATGYPIGKKHKPRYPTETVLKKVAALMCNIQKRNPKVKTFKAHKNFTKTECPGTIQSKFDSLVTYTKELGCDFSY